MRLDFNGEPVAVSVGMESSVASPAWLGFSAYFEFNRVPVKSVTGVHLHRASELWINGTSSDQKQRQEEKELFHAPRMAAIGGTPNVIDV
ncbi:hypothetical protein OMCYN_01730 [cyanobiont of Ornithocercus magnificus]|nr:hypothetical protein OMCYN_01730 [cyanobiont of Ornithocercus magnificus]